jgi:hypothetical protein
MFAHIGDRLIVDGDPARTGLIIGTPQDDGSPPYIVKWLANGHIAMVSPGQFARIVPAHHHTDARDDVPVTNHLQVLPSAIVVERDSGSRARGRGTRDLRQCRRPLAA